MPEVPTMIEVGVPGFVSDTWNALSAPPKTPKAITAKINAAVNAILADDEVKARYEALHLTLGGGTSEEMGAFVRQETKRWGEVIRAANIPQE
jgi:tripartite-type tricarboxylate transporter receptor subunit TctC